MAKDGRINPFRPPHPQGNERFIYQERKALAKEPNPTSNLKISYMPTQTTHPFMEYYNVGLNSSGPYRSISASINTDDSDVFGTSFKRESSLVAAA